MQEDFFHDEWLFVAQSAGDGAILRGTHDLGRRNVDLGMFLGHVRRVV
jgi:hypothetical protein